MVLVLDVTCDLLPKEVDRNVLYSLAAFVPLFGAPHAFYRAIDLITRLP
jgi:hypothetical protein